MSGASKNPGESSQTLPVKRLIELYLSQEATPDECRELSRQIVESTEVRDEYVRQAVIHNGLVEYARKREAVDAVRRLRGEGVLPSQPKQNVHVDASIEVEHQIRQLARQRLVRRSIVAALMSLAATLLFILIQRVPEADEESTAELDSGRASTEEIAVEATMPTATPSLDSDPRWVVIGTEQDMEVTDQIVDRSRFVLGPGRFQMLPQDGLPHSIEIDSGTLVAWLPVSLDDATVTCRELKLSGAGCLFGVSNIDGRTRVAVFRGELTVEHQDWLHRTKLTRDDGLELLQDGSVITALVGAQKRFVSLRRLLKIDSTGISNGTFDYPRLASVEPKAPRIPAGWTLVSHPIANADGMMSEGGLSISRERGRQLSAAKRRSQYAFCEANTYADGKSSWSSLHQGIGHLSSLGSYSVRVTVANPKRKQAVGKVSLFAGEDDEGPTTPLSDHPFEILATDKEKVVEIRVDSAVDSSLSDQVLFVVLSASAPAEFGTNRVFFDKVELLNLQP